MTAVGRCPIKNGDSLVMVTSRVNLVPVSEGNREPRNQIYYFKSTDGGAANQMWTLTGDGQLESHLNRDLLLMDVLRMETPNPAQR